MWLVSNIFITRAIDCIDTYSHLGGDAAAYVSHAKDAAGVKLLNKLDIDGIYLLGHTVVDWQGERWVCQSMLPGIFSRRQEEEKPIEVESGVEGEKEKKEDWVKVPGHSPSKSVDSDAVTDGRDEPAENPLIIYGLDSEHVTSLHWDEATHKIMEKVASACRLAPHKIAAGKDEKEFYASAEVKALRGTDGRRYLLDLPRLNPVDIEWLEKDIDGKLAGPEKDVDGPKYPHRVALLRPELIETFWEGELKRWARSVATADQAKKDAEKQIEVNEEKPGESSKTELPLSEGNTDGQSPAAEAAAAQRAEDEQPIDVSVVSESITQFELRFNPDAFVEQASARDAEDKTVPIPSKVTDESDPSIKAVRDASVFLRTVAIPAIALDVLTGNVSGIMDGASLSKLMHTRGVNIRYLGHLAATVIQFSAVPSGEQRVESGHLAAFKVRFQMFGLLMLTSPGHRSTRDGPSREQAHPPPSHPWLATRACPLCCIAFPQLPAWLLSRCVSFRHL
jgi:protein TIF31